jgi:6-pyruvoyltetrahydropterin/6-carboxytetrahydropterin synthase
MNLQILRLTKIFEFEMAHVLWNYDGKCKNIHGHSYKLHVTVSGIPVNDDSNKKNGMVMDFGDLKKIVKEKIIDTHDHSFAVYNKSPITKIFEEGFDIDKKQIKPYQPTAENMVIEFSEIIKNYLPSNIKLHSLKLYETANSFVEWNADDNL